MNKMELRKKAFLSTGTMAKRGKNESVTTKVLVKICEELQCDVADIMEIIPNAESEQNEKE